MAKLTDKASLNVGTEIVIDENAKTIQLLEDGNLVAKDGVTLQAVYSKLVDLWATADYQDSPFPMYAIDALSGQFQIGTDGATFSGWTWADDTTREMLRDGGWTEYSSGGAVDREYAGFIGLGNINTGAQPYYILDATAASGTDFPFDDQFNVGIRVDTSAQDYAKAFVREYGKKYKESILSDTGKTNTGAYIVNFLISNEDDLKVTDTLGTTVEATGDALMAGAPYDNINVSYYTLAQSREIGGSNYDFKVIIDGNNATLEQIYCKIQYLLRQSGDINDSGTAGVKNGEVQDELLTFVGDTLVTSQSVYIDNVNANDTNRVEFVDDTGTTRTNPFVAAGTLKFNSFLIGAGSSYRLMYKYGPGANADYGETNAVTVLDNLDNPITGTISSSEISFDFDYDGDSAGAASEGGAGVSGVDKPVVLVGIRPGYGKFVVAEGTLTRAKGITIALTAEQDRVYA